MLREASFRMMRRKARVVIYYEYGVGMLELMGLVPALLHAEWPSVEYNRVYLLDDQSIGSISAEQCR